LEDREWEGFDGGGRPLDERPHRRVTPVGDDRSASDLAAELEEARRTLDRERERYLELFDLAPIGYAVTDRDGLFREVNRAAADLVGVAADSLIGKPLAAFVPPAERPSFRRRLTELATSPGTRTWETTLVGRSGADRVVEVTVTPSIGASRELDEMRWVLVDVTHRIETERSIRGFATELELRVAERTAELEEQRARLQTVVDNMPAGLVIVAADRRVLLANGRALEILGVDEEEIAGREWESYRMDGRRYEMEEFPLERTLRTGESVRNERVELVAASGVRVITDVSTAPVVDSGGNAVGALWLFQDMTLQERQERAEREFVTNAAHELQSPLAAIVSAIEVLQSGAKDGPQRDVFLAHIEREADRLARLVRALLILARTQTGLEAPRDELVGLCSLLEDIGAGLQLSSSVELVVDCPEDLAVLTNRELVEQALVNLAENAAKHTRTGRIALSASEAENGVLELTVADTGPGIAASERPRIFERFYRPDPNGSTGFGLGLAIVRAVADALDGELELDSNVEAGTVVRLRIPNAATLVTQ
jgi:PAS domain S-box-containing protein